jgi:uncharacterized membrane protein YdjX (TVP38/TMEM64 family)
LLAVLVIAPFLLFGARIEAWAHALLLDRRPAGLAPRALCVLLLASDVVLPVPSSVVSTAAGLWWGLWAGAGLSTLGMQLGSWLGYALGMRATALRRWVGEDEAERLHRAFVRHGEWIVVTLRPVPVLAEASAVFAGFSRMDVRRYTALSLAANACVSLFYAAAGALLRDRAPGAGMVLLIATLVAVAGAWSWARRLRR